MQVVFYVIMFILGTCLGSFLCCQARRLYLKETKHQSLGRRSVCPRCKHQLRWYENLPLISWLLQRGKCRKCHHKIGSAEIISEFATGLALLGLATTLDIVAAAPWDYAIFCLTTLLALVLIFLAIYDGLYGELPTIMLVVAAVVAAILVSVKLAHIYTESTFSMEPIGELLAAIAILGGLYLVLYLVSHSKWVGDGDWILGSVIAAALGTPWLALIALFIANLSATVITLPLLKSRKSHKIYFGPFLVFAFILTLILAHFGLLEMPTI